MCHLTRPDRSVDSNLAAVIDLKLLRGDPDAVRRFERSRGEDRRWWMCY